MAEYRRYCEWFQYGRRVKRGTKATHYFYDPVSGATEAVFSFDQTEPLPSTEGWQLIQAADKPKQPTRPKTKRVFVEYDGDTVRIHVGARKDLIELLKKHSFRFQPATGRWWRKATQQEVDAAVRVFEKRGYEVVFRDAHEKF